MKKSRTSHKILPLALSIAAICATLVVPAAHASNADFGTISQFYGTNNGALMFSTSGTRTTAPSCSTNPQRFAIDASTTAGQAAASLVLTAYALHKQVYVVGTGTCSIWGDTETVLFIRMQD